VRSICEPASPPTCGGCQDPDLGPEMAGVGGDVAKRRRARVKQPGVQTGPVAIGQRQEPMREREDDVDVLRRASAAAGSSRPVPPVTHAALYVLRVTPLPVGRRASGFVLVAQYLPIGLGRLGTPVQTLIQPLCIDCQQIQAQPSEGRLSTMVRDQSMSPSRASQLTSAQCSDPICRLPASRAVVLHQVIPDPQPSSVGSICQGIPLHKTNRMRVNDQGRAAVHASVAAGEPVRAVRSPCEPEYPVHRKPLLDLPVIHPSSAQCARANCTIARSAQ
jgi:hypothetical protein